HEDRPDLRVAAFKWFNKHLKRDNDEIKEVALKPLPGKELRVFPEDKDIPKDAINGKIDETFVPLAKVELPKEGDFPEWKKGLLKELHEKSFRAFSEGISSAKPEEGSRFSTEPGIEVEVTRAILSPEPDSLVVFDRGKGKPSPDSLPYLK